MDASAQPPADERSGVMAAPAPERPPCQHDSLRGDGSLDDHCLRCGLTGYWHEGARHDEIHPSGKILFRFEGVVA